MCKTGRRKKQKGGTGASGSGDGGVPTETAETIKSLVASTKQVQQAQSGLMQGIDRIKQKLDAFGHGKGAGHGNSADKPKGATKPPWRQRGGRKHQMVTGRAEPL